MLHRDWKGLSKSLRLTATESQKRSDCWLNNVATNRKLKVAQEFLEYANKRDIFEQVQNLMRVRAFSFCLACTCYPGRYLLGTFSDLEMQMRPTC